MDNSTPSSDNYTLRVYECLRFAASLWPSDYETDNPNPEQLERFSERLDKLKEQLTAVHPANNDVALDDFAVVWPKTPRYLTKIGRVSYHDAALWWVLSHYLALTKEEKNSGLEAAVKLYQTFPKIPLALYESNLERERILVEHASKKSAAKPKEGEGNGGKDAMPKQPAVESGADRAAILANMQPADRKAYLAFQYAESKVGKELQDREAYEWLKENGIDTDKGDVGELADYVLPAFDTWSKQVRNARKPLGEQKNTRRGGRATGKSIVRANVV